MKGTYRILFLAGLFSLALFITAAPTFAECCGTCGGQESECTDKAGCDCSNCDKCSSQDMAAAMADCVICADLFEDMDLMMACDYNVSDFSEGIIFTLNMKQPEMMDRFRACQEKDKKSAKKYLALSSEACSEKLCPMCAEYFDLRRNGLSEENIDTPTGAITIARTGNPAVLKRAHAWADGVRKMVASFDPSQFGGEAKACSEGAPQEKAAAMPEMSPEMMAEFQNCALCSMYIESPDMMTAAKGNVIMLNNGMAMCSTVLDQSKVKAYQAFNKKFHDKVDVIMKQPWDESSKKVCHICRQFGELHNAGAEMEWCDTPTGTMTIVISEKPNLQKKIHALGKELLSYMEM
jgi:hypothetical protein